MTSPRSWSVSFALVLVLAGCGGDDGTADSGNGSTSTGGTTSDGSTSLPPPDDTTTEVGSTGAGSTSAGSTGADSTGADSTGADSTGAVATTIMMQTTLGDIVIELDPVAAPITVANFLAYVDAGFYDGTDGMAPTVFHRVIPGFMIQGGGLDENLAPKPTMPEIVNESGNGLTNVRGAIAMARRADPDTATSQFFINVVDNPFLDDPPGYAVFGQVVEGMDIVDMIVAVPTESVGMFDDVPIDPITIESVTVM